MKVKIIRNTVAGGQNVSRGDVVELSKNEANYLIRLKKAVVHVDAKAEEDSDDLVSPRIADENPKRKVGRPPKES